MYNTWKMVKDASNHIPIKIMSRPRPHGKYIKTVYHNIPGGFNYSKNHCKLVFKPITAPDQKNVIDLLCGG